MPPATHCNVRTDVTFIIIISSASEEEEMDERNKECPVKFNATKTRRGANAGVRGAIEDTRRVIVTMAPNCFATNR